MEVALPASRPLHAPVGFVNDEVQPVSFVPCSVGQGLPDGILAGIGMPAQIACLAQLLGVEEVDMSILQHLHIKGLVLNGDTLAEADLVCLQIDFLPGLFIQCRRIGQPDEDGFGLLRKLFGAVIDLFDQRCHDDGLAGTGGSLQGDHLGDMESAVIVQGKCCFQPQVSNCPFLKGE